jgi:hypothetical protein
MAIEFEGEGLEVDDEERPGPVAVHRGISVPILERLIVRDPERGAKALTFAGVSHVWTA